MSIPPGDRKICPIPFVIDRSASHTITEQIVSGISEAIRSGRFHPGARLPNIVSIAKQLQVSELVVRNAIQRLTGRGELVARPKTGIEVLGSAQTVWKRHVLFLTRSSALYFSMRDQRFSEILGDARIRLSSVLLDDREMRLGMPRVKTVLDCQTVDLALVEGLHSFAAPELIQRKIPFLSLEPDDPPYAEAVGRIVKVEGQSLTELAMHLRDCQVRSVAVLSPASRAEEIIRIFTAMGIESELLLNSGMPGAPEVLESEGWALTGRLLEAGRALPDAIHYHDDYLARGGLMCLFRFGVRVPEQVQVTLAANRGHCPFAGIHLTRVERDPEEDARVIGGAVLEALDAPRRKNEWMYGPRLVIGDSTRRSPSAG
jgi:DNA-binding transcriptional regulator YhcF (GntR family)